MKRTVSLFLACFLLAPGPGIAQQAVIDSLLKQLPAHGADTGRVNLLNKLSWKYWETGQYDPALTHAQAAKELAGQLGFHIGVAQALSELGLVHEYRGDLSRALEQYSAALDAARTSGHEVMVANCNTNIGILLQKQGNYAGAFGSYSEALKTYQALGNSKGVAASYLNMGYVNSLQGNYPEALRYYYESLQIQDDLGGQRAMANIRTNIGIVLFRQKDYTGALASYRAAQAIRQRLNDKEGLAGGHVNMGMIHQAQGNLPLALENFLKALAIDREIGNLGGVASDHASIGGIEAAQGRYPEALGSLRTALQLSDSIGDKRGVAAACMAIGAIKLKLGQPLEARASMLKTLEIGRATDAKEDIKNAYQGLASTDSALGNYRSALANYKMYTLYKDSLFNEKNTRKLTQTAMQYTFDKKTLADSLQHVAEQRSMGAKLERQRTARNGVIAFTLLLIAGGGLWLRADRKRRKERFRKETAELETRILRAQMNPHFIFNALNSIHAYMQQHNMDRASSFLSKFAKVMRGVLENSRHKEVPLHDDLEVLRGYLELERKRMDDKFDFSITVDPTLDPQQVLVPPLVVQPLVENAIWHGLSRKQGKGCITLDITRKGDQLIWTIEDDGVGRSMASRFKDPAQDGKAPGSGKKSLGIAITQSRLELLKQQYGGNIGLWYEAVPQGTRAVVDMPVIMA